MFYVPGQDTLVSQGLSSLRSLNGNSNLPGKADELYGGGGGGIDCDGPASHVEGGGEGLARIASNHLLLRKLE